MLILYEAVFGLSDICCPFSVYSRIGHILVDLDGVSLAELIKVSSVFVVEEDEKGCDLKSLFAIPVGRCTAIMFND